MLAGGVYKGVIGVAGVVGCRILGQTHRSALTLLVRFLFSKRKRMEEVEMESWVGVQAEGD